MTIQQGADGAHHFLGSGGFGEVVICAEIHARGRVLFVSAGSEADEGDGDGCAVSAEGLQHALTIHTWHGDLAEDDVGLVEFCQGDAGTPICGGHNCEAFHFERQDEAVESLVLISDHENGFQRVL